MIVPDAETAGGERVKVLDFGLAKLADLEDPDSANLTRTGTLMGTPAYMAPEQCRSARSATDRSDVYALGCIMYEMLAGSPPFTANNDLDVLAGHMYKQPVPLSEEAPAASPELAALIHRMLSKKADDRPSAAEVATQLSRLGGGLQSSTGIPTAMLGAALAAKAARDGKHGDGVASSLSPTSRPTTIRPGGRKTRVLVGVALGSLVLLLSGGVALYQRSAHKQQVAEPATVTWKIDSSPSGADVIGPEGEVLGKTPLSLTRPRSKGAFDLKLHLDGYGEKGLALDQGQDQSLTEKLTPLPPTAKPDDTATPEKNPAQGADDTKKPGKGSKKDRKGKKGKGK